MNRNTAWMAVLLVLAASPARGVSPETWRLSGLEGWSRAERESVAVTSEGFLRLASGARRLDDLSAFVVWDLLPDGRDVLAATGDDGVLYRITSRGEVDEVARLVQPELTALGRDSRGRVLVAGAPDGTVYRIEKGEAVQVADVPESYVWRIVPGPEGSLLLATGDVGRIYRLGPDDALELFADLRAAHVTGLAPDGDSFIATTDSPGRVVRLGREGEMEILHDAEEPELRSPVVLGDGTICFLANPESEPGRVYRLNGSGAADRLWTAPEGYVYRLAARDAGTLWVTTGATEGAGSLVELAVDPPRSWVEVVRVEEPQVLAFLPGPESNPRWLGTGGGGALYRILDGSAAGGSVTSPVEDAGSRARWGALSVEPGPPGDGVVLETRSGNTRTPDETWSSWTRVELENERGNVPSPAARFLQWRARFERAGARIGGVRVVYLPANLAPRIESVSVSDLGAPLEQPFDRGQPSSMIQQLPGGIRVEFQTGQRPGTEEAGDEAAAWARRYRTLTWEAADPNQDPLRFDVVIRGAGERTWRPLVEDLESSPWVWDSATVPDGWYEVEVRASDRAANPPALGLSASRASDPFLVDNTAPVVKGLSVDRSTLSGVAEDASSAIKRLEIAVDGQPWIRVFPEDGIPDMPRETFSTPLTDLPSGDHVIVVRAFDLAGNPGTGRLMFRMP